MANASLFPNMQPLHFHVVAIAHFSETAMNAAFSGEISGPNMDLSLDFEGLIEHLKTARANIARLDENEINTRAEGEVIFEYSDINLPFTTEDFFLTYALPSFYFHVSIAYGILRSLGVHIGVASFFGYSQNDAIEKLARGGASAHWRTIFGDAEAVGFALGLRRFLCGD